MSHARVDEVVREAVVRGFVSVVVGKALSGQRHATHNRMLIIENRPEFRGGSVNNRGLKQTKRIDSIVMFQ